MTTFPISTMLDLGLTNDKLQEQLVANGADSNMSMEVLGDITTIWMYALNVRVEIKDSKITKLFNLNNSSEVYTSTRQEDLIADINALHEKKQGKCLLITVAYDKTIQEFSDRLVKMGEFLEYIIGGGLK